MNHAVHIAGGLMLIGVLGLGACTEKTDRVYFSGNYYPTKAKSVRGDREQFVVTVRRAAQGIEGAREAGRHGAVTYCIKNFGYSEIDWQVGPDSTDAALQVANGNLIMRGTCVVW